MLRIREKLKWNLSKICFCSLGKYFKNTYWVSWGNISAHVLPPPPICAQFLWNFNTWKSTITRQKYNGWFFTCERILALIQWFYNSISLNRRLCVLVSFLQLLKHLFIEQKEYQWKTYSFNEIGPRDEQSERGRKH